jgi:uroporphyrin-III C-methyltransferase/precorrin-2 dehydrogenase/sirohydrochlorin ferrochelatase
VPEPTDGYLVGLRLAGRRVVVVGAGTVAQRRLPDLLEAGADVVLVAPEVTATIEPLVTSGALTWIPRGYTPGDLSGAWYAMAATNDPQVNGAVVAEAEESRVFCVRADAGRAATALTPATGRHGAVRVGVLGGGDPRRAVAVRDGIVEALREGRLDDLPRRPHPGTRAGEPGEGAVPGVAIVGGGPGDPDLITVRGRRLLAHADVVVADRLAPQQLLAELAPHVEVIDAAKLPRGRSMAQQQINEILVERARSGRYVVRLKGGDPFVFGRGSEEVEACVAAGVPVTVVPGITSAIAVPGRAGIPLTHRGVAHEAVVLSGHLSPDDPASLIDWKHLAGLSGTLVLLMAVERLPEIAAALMRHGRSGDTPVAVVQDGTLPTERVVVATLDTIAQVAAREAVRPPAIVVVGGVVALRERLVPASE